MIDADTGDAELAIMLTDDAGIRTLGGMIILGIQSTRFIVTDIVTRKFSWREYFEQAWFMTRVSFLPTILVAIPLGVIVAIQVGGVAEQIGAVSFSGAVNGVGVLRQAAPLVTSLLMAGAVVLLCALMLSGTSPAGPSWSIGAGLFLLGLGWSFCTVAASALLSESAPLSVRTDVQGAADLVMGVVAAAAGALAGVIVGTLGYPTLNIFAALLAAGVATAAEFARRTSGERSADEDTLGI